MCNSNRGSIWAASPIKWSECVKIFTKNGFCIYKKAKPAGRRNWDDSFARNRGVQLELEPQGQKACNLIFYCTLGGLTFLRTLNLFKPQ